MVASPVSSLFQRAFLSDGQGRWPYALFIPPGYATDGADDWPLVLFLHGIGERGNDGLAQTRVGIGPAIAANPDQFRCLVALPQCPAEQRWTENLWLVDRTWETVAESWRVDPRRVVVTGVSMGGFGSWAYGARRAIDLAAALPVCGGGRVESAGPLAQLPVWAFHGSKDEVIDAQRSRDMVQAVRQAGGEVRYTEFAEEGHDCWDRVYGDPAVVSWMLAQTSTGS